MLVDGIVIARCGVYQSQMTKALPTLDDAHTRLRFRRKWPDSSFMTNFPTFDVSFKELDDARILGLPAELRLTMDTSESYAERLGNSIIASGSYDSVSYTHLRSPRD